MNRIQVSIISLAFGIIVAAVGSQPIPPAPNPPTAFQSRVSPTLYDETGHYDVAKLRGWVKAGNWGKAGFVVSRVPATAVYPIGWMSVGQVFLMGDTFYIKINKHDGGVSWAVDLQTGEQTWQYPEREVKMVTFKAFVTVPSD